MASTTHISQPPLSFMTKLNQNTFYFDPSVPTSPDHPRLILLLAWMGAADVHIAKYVSQHQISFPTSRILVVKFSMNLFLGQSVRNRILEPAVHVLKMFAKEMETDTGENAKLLVHVFSNGGITTCVCLWDLMNQDLPPHVLILDSCPGYHSWKRTHHALALSLPTILSPLVHAFIGVLWLLRAPWGIPPPQDTNAAALNTKTRLSREIRRTYLYGTGDEAVDWRDVERHAAEAKTVLGDDNDRVRLERFEGGRHVAHVRIDAERYWRTVKETWKGGQI